MWKREEETGSKERERERERRGRKGKLAGYRGISEIRFLSFPEEKQLEAFADFRSS